MRSAPSQINYSRSFIDDLQPSDFNQLNIIHIAGTKGKGSTSAFISSILAQYLPSLSQPTPLLHKIGLYTSPHLRFVRERIQINNEPLSEELFAKYFFEIWDRLEEAAKVRNLPVDVTAKPVYFRFLTLMALHTYMSEGVDTAVIECGIGGEYDSTNIVTAPTVTGITSLGIDHVGMLGNTIEEIAWHKAGIMKHGAPAFTSPQPLGALQVLQNRALEKSVSLKVVEKNPLLSTIKLGLAADFQNFNASLAIVVASTHLKALSRPISIGHELGVGEKDIPEDDMYTKQENANKESFEEESLHENELHTFSPPRSLPLEFMHGLENVRWPGRCETRREAHITWYIDGGHTFESIEASGTWFASQLPHSTPPKTLRILIFNQQTRDADALARALHRVLASTLQEERPFTHAIFCSNVTFRDAGYSPDLVSLNTNPQAVKQLDVQKRLAETWRAVDAEADVGVVGTIEEAVEKVRGLSKGEKEGQVKVLVTGSLHLVGGFLDVLERKR